MPDVIRLSMTRFDLPKLIDAMHIERGVEIGVGHGYFSHHLLSNSKLKQLWSVDPYESNPPVGKDATSLLSEHGERSRFLKCRSIQARSAAADEGVTFGFVYVDGGHKEGDVTCDINAWHERLERPGLLCGHDYVGGRSSGVIPAVHRFADKMKMPIYLTREPRLASWILIFGAE